MDSIEYERRKAFCETMKSMGHSEYIEIARILRKHNITTSENRSGLFFDMGKLPQEVFDALLVFCEFVQQNNTELDKRGDSEKRADTKSARSKKITHLTK